MEKLIRLYPLNASLSCQPSRLVCMGGGAPSHAEVMAKRAEEIRKIGEANEATKAEAEARTQVAAAIGAGDGDKIWEASKGLAGALWDKHVGPIQDWAGEKASEAGQTAVDVAGQVANKMVDRVINEAIPGPLGAGTVRASARLVTSDAALEGAQAYARAVDTAVIQPAKDAYEYYAGGQAGRDLEEIPGALGIGVEQAKDAAYALGEKVQKKGRDVAGTTEVERQLRVVQRDLIRARTQLEAGAQGDVTKALADAGQLGPAVAKNVKTQKPLNVRANPSLSAPVLASVKPGESVNVNLNPPREIKADGYAWTYSAEKNGWLASGPVSKPNSYLA